MGKVARRERGVSRLEGFTGRPQEAKSDQTKSSPQKPRSEKVRTRPAGDSLTCSAERVGKPPPPPHSTQRSSPLHRSRLSVFRFRRCFLHGQKNVEIDLKPEQEAKEETAQVRQPSFSRPGFGVTAAGHVPLSWTCRRPGALGGVLLAGHFPLCLWAWVLPITYPPQIQVSLWWCWWGLWGGEGRAGER